MFLLLMPIFAAPWEALAAFRESANSSCGVERAKLITVFMGVGVPMYYVTAHSRAAKVGSAYVDPGAVAGGASGFKATAQSKYRQACSCLVFLVELTHQRPGRRSSRTSAALCLRACGRCCISGQATRRTRRCSTACSRTTRCPSATGGSEPSGSIRDSSNDTTRNSIDATFDMHAGQRACSPSLRSSTTSTTLFFRTCLCGMVGAHWLH